MKIQNKTAERPLQVEGKIVATKGPLLIARMPIASLGAQVVIHIAAGHSVAGVVTAFSGDHISIAPLGDIDGLTSTSIVTSNGHPLSLFLPCQMQGLILDALGKQLNRQTSNDEQSIRIVLNQTPPAALDRMPIAEQMITGISAIDGFSPIGIGQRLSLSAPAGTGKSTLLGMIIRNCDVDHIVIGLIGERGREVKDFIEDVLGSCGIARSTIVVSTSDEAPIRKVVAAQTAFAISEHYRHRGKRVLLVVDSLTRLARAMRDLGLANGEMPVRQGYPASVLVSLPRLLERAGNNHCGSITAIFSLLQEESNGNDYLSHEVASLLDGHLILDPTLAERGHFPAIDVTKSLSRVTTKLLPLHLNTQRTTIIRSLSRLYRERDLLLLGGNPDTELAKVIAMEDDINTLLAQRRSENRSWADTSKGLSSLATRLEK